MNAILNVGYRRKILINVLLILLIITCLNIILFVSQKPIYGYANNFDFLRQSACVGLWQNSEDKPREAGNAKKVYGTLINDGIIRMHHCQISSGTLVPYIHAKITFINQVISITRIGMTLGIIAILSILVMMTLSMPNIITTSIILLSFAGVFLDFKNLLYFNTLYLEPIYLISCLSSFGLLVILSTLSTDETRTKKYLAILSFILSTFILGLSKEQYVPLACIFLIIGFRVLSSKGIKKLAVVCLLSVMCIPSTYYHLNKGDGTIIGAIVDANKTNTFLGAVLPNSHNKSEALDILNLPQDCIGAIGLNWASPGLQQNHPCPQVLKKSRVELIKLISLQPETLYETINYGILLLRPFGSPDLSFREDGIAGASDNLFIRGLSLTSIYEHISADLFLVVNYVGFFCGILFLSIILIRPQSIIHYRSNLQPFIFSIGIAGLINFYSIFSSVFGDGFSEIPRHAIGVLIAYSIYIACLIASFGIFFKKLNKLFKVFLDERNLNT